MSSVAIEAIAYELAPQRFSSAELEAQLADTMRRLRLRPGQLERLTGIRERGHWDRDTMPSEMATVAARKLLDAYGIDPQRIDCLINTSVTKDYAEPSVACLVHGNLGLSPACVNFDVGNACLGFLNGMEIIARMIEQGVVRYGLVVNAESTRMGVENTLQKLQSDDIDRPTFLANLATLTMGSGAVAMLLCHKDLSRSGHVFNGSVSLTATQHNRLCLGQMDHMVVDGHALMVAGVELAEDTWKVAAERLPSWSDSSIDHYVPHQVSTRHTGHLCDSLGLDAGKFVLTVQDHGNIGPAGLPIALAMAAEDGRLQRHDHVALLGFGSGVNCAMMSITW